jgi:hypothetical protein
VFAAVNMLIATRTFTYSAAIIEFPMLATPSESAISVAFAYVASTITCVFAAVNMLITTTTFVDIAATTLVYLAATTFVSSTTATVIDSEAFVEFSMLVTPAESTISVAFAYVASAITCVFAAVANDTTTTFVNTAATTFIE